MSASRSQPPAHSVLTGALASIALPFLAPWIWYRADQELARIAQRGARTRRDERRALELAHRIAIATTYALVVLVSLVLSLLP